MNWTIPLEPTKNPKNCKERVFRLLLHYYSILRASLPLALSFSLSLILSLCPAIIFCCAVWLSELICCFMNRQKYTPKNEKYEQRRTKSPKTKTNSNSKRRRGPRAKVAGDGSKEIEYKTAPPVKNRGTRRWRNSSSSSSSSLKSLSSSRGRRREERETGEREGTETKRGDC